MFYESNESMSHESWVMSQWVRSEKIKVSVETIKLSIYFYLICLLASLLPISPGGEDSAYERGGDARRKFWIKPLKETDLGEAQTFFDP